MDIRSGCKIGRGRVSEAAGRVGGISGDGGWSGEEEGRTVASRRSGRCTWKCTSFAGRTSRGALFGLGSRLLGRMLGSVSLVSACGWTGVRI